MDLYLHVILSHFPDFFDECSLYITSTEPLEGLFITTKRCKHSTNRHKRNILKTVLKRFEHKNLKEIVVSIDDPNRIWEASQEKKTSFRITGRFSGNLRTYQLKYLKILIILWWVNKLTHLFNVLRTISIIRNTGD